MNATIELTKLRIKKLMTALSTTSYRTALTGHKVLAASEHEFPLSLLTDVDMVVDIGANRGQFSLAARQKFPKVPVLAFEPYPESAKVFRSIFASDPFVYLEECALGESRGRNRFFVTEANDSSSMLPPSAEQIGYFPGSAVVKEFIVEVFRLDSFKSKLGARTLVKVDVQGGEGKVILGATSAIDLIKYFYIECSFVELYVGQHLSGEVIDLLSRNGFQLAGIYNPMIRDASLIQADLLFKRVTPY